MQQPHMEEEMEIDLKELFFELLAHWKMIVLSAILTGVIAMLVNIFLITPKYQSTYGLYVLTKSSETTSLSDLQTGSNLTNDYMVVTVSPPGVRPGDRESEPGYGLCRTEGYDFPE